MPRLIAVQVWRGNGIASTKYIGNGKGGQVRGVSFCSVGCDWTPTTVQSQRVPYLGNIYHLFRLICSLSTVLAFHRCERPSARRQRPNFADTPRNDRVTPCSLHSSTRRKPMPQIRINESIDVRLSPVHFPCSHPSPSSRCRI